MEEVNDLIKRGGWTPNTLLFGELLGVQNMDQCYEVNDLMLGGEGEHPSTFLHGKHWESVNPWSGLATSGGGH